MCNFCDVWGQANNQGLGGTTRNKKHMEVFFETPCSLLDYFR